MSYIEDLKTFIAWIFIAFCIGISLHFGTNTAKLIWPTIPVEFEVTVSE